MSSKPRPKSTSHQRPKTMAKRTSMGTTKTLLFRLREKDSPSGISASTLKKLSSTLGMPETQVIHQALRKMAEDFIPAYEADDGPVSDATLNALKAREPQDRYTTVVSTLLPG